MTKAESKKVKSLINTEGDKYTATHSDKTGLLSIRVYTYINNNYDPEREAEAIEKLVGKLGGMEYQVKRRTYQGFIHDTDIIIG